MTKEAAFNLFELRKYKAIKLEAEGNHLRLVFEPRPGERGLMSGFAPPPHAVESDRFEPSTQNLSPSERMFITGDASYLGAARILQRFDEWGQAAQAALQNKQLSPNGQHAQLFQATVTAVTAVGTQFAGLERIAGELAQRHAALYAAPERDTTEAAIDCYLYSRFDTLDASAQIARVADGKADRLLDALARHPDRGALHAEVLKRLDEVWAARVAKLQPVAVAELTIAEAANEWARGLAKWVATLLANPSTSGTTGKLDRFALYKVLKAVNAINLLEYSPQDVAMYERRIAAIAA